MRKCIHCPRKGEPPGKTTVWQAVILWDVQILQQTSGKYPETANNERQGERSKQTSTAHSVLTPVAAQHELGDISSGPASRLGGGVPFWPSGSRAKGAALRCMELLTQQPPTWLHQNLRGQKSMVAPGGQCPALCMQQEKWLWHCLSSAGQTGKSQAEVMSRKWWATLQGTNCSMDAMLLPTQPTGFLTP